MDWNWLLGTGKFPPHRKVGTILFHQALHAAVGAAVAGGLLAVWAIGPWAIAAAGAAGAAWEVQQLIRNHAPHLLDRALDLSAFLLGGTLSWIASLFF